MEEHGDTPTTVVSHNFRGFDGQFVIRSLLDSGRTPDVIMNGCKIMSLIWAKNLRFIDSLSFIPASLSQFPKMFGLTLDADQSLLAKGYFPHLFHTQEAMAANYVGPMPPRHLYDPEGMSPEKRQAFVTWYDAQVEANHVFNLREELIDYCRNDVIILREGAVKFCQSFQEINNVNPMKNAITLAAICNKIYRADHMPPKTIPFVPANGYTPQTNQSHVALEWLLWLNHQDAWGGEIQHVWNGGEFRPILGKGSVDGYHPPSRTCFEFNGCFWHGCPKCKDPHTVNPRTQHTMEQLYRITQQKEKALKDLGYTVITLWECEWNKRKESDMILREWCDANKLVTPLIQRDAFYGGRTGCTKLKSAVGEENVEQLQYLDFTSLYPTCNICRRHDETLEPNPDPGTKPPPERTELLGSWDVDDMDPYPLGHPVIERYTQPRHYNRGWRGGQGMSLDISEVYGYVKCTILPPRQLYHPVLPYRSNGKLMFPLCAACAETQNQTYCTHSDLNAVCWVRGFLRKLRWHYVLAMSSRMCGRPGTTPDGHDGCSDLTFNRFRN